MAAGKGLRGACIPGWTAFLLVVGWWLLAAPVEERVAVAVNDVVFVLAPVVSGALVLRAAFAFTGRRRAAWASLACGLFAWAGGQVVWTVKEVLLRRTELFPSWADAGYLLLPVAAAAALVLYPVEGRGGVRRPLRRFIDGAILAGAVLLISWSTVLGAVAKEGAESGLAYVVAIAYPAFDVMVLSTALLVLSRSRRSERRALAVLCAGLAALAISDSLFAWLNVNLSYQSGGLADLGWYVAFALVAVAARTDRVPADRPYDEQAVTEGDFAAVLLPYLPLTIVAVSLIVRVLVEHRLDQVEAVGVSVLAVLVLIRQYLTLRDNQALTRELSATEARLRHLAFHDALTGLANRTLFSDRLAHALAVRERDLRPVALIFLDLDDFKHVNDTHGHATGDAVLVQIAGRLRGCLRSGDTVARLGGDEFAVLLEAGAQEPEIVGERLLEAFAEPFEVTGSSLSVGVSIGIVHVPDGAAVTDASALLDEADVAMYAAKRGGKGNLWLSIQDPPHDKR